MNDDQVQKFTEAIENFDRHLKDLAAQLAEIDQAGGALDVQLKALQATVPDATIKALRAFNKGELSLLQLREKAILNLLPEN